jgi:lipoprotein signal peptidase
LHHQGSRGLVVPSGVTDFIDIGVGSLRFWLFNVADAGITIGAILLAVALMRPRSILPSHRSS